MEKATYSNHFMNVELSEVQYMLSYLQSRNNMRDV